MPIWNDEQSIFASLHSLITGLDCNETSQAQQRFDFKPILTQDQSTLDALKQQGRILFAGSLLGGGIAQEDGGYFGDDKGCGV